MRTINRCYMGAGIIAFAWLALSAAAEESTVLKEQSRPAVEAVFVLDTTGSMGSLIAGAKEKIWSIANTLATADPAPEIKIGLIAYRDRGDAYVTQITPMTSDLDLVYSKLMEFKAAGGGDEPESVNRALNEAVTQIDWSSDTNTYKVVFLVGDCPPHMDYQDDIKYPETCLAAGMHEIMINTVLCGANSGAMKIWKDIALKAEGRFFQVEQNGNAVMVECPQDKELAELAKELDQTRIYYGSGSERAAGSSRAKLADRLTKDSSYSVQAQRALFNTSAAGNVNFARGNELVLAYQEDPSVLDRIAVEELPEEFAEMNATERDEYVEMQSAKRKELQKKIQELSTERQAFLQKEMAKVEGMREKSLEYNVYQTIKEQTVDKSVSFEAMDALY
jgi:Mg-chelatase subunit ChlD